MYLNKRGEIMKKTLLYLIFPIFLVSCGGSDSSVNVSSVSEESSSSETITTTLKQMMSEYQKLGNYTYTVDDRIFDITTTLRYTKNAFYYQPDKEEHGGNPYGYAENETGVFPFTITDDGVKMEAYLTDSKGEYIHNMWFTKILSFLDIDIDALPDEAEEEKIYRITDANNKLLISGLAGFGDAVLQNYIDVYIELTSDVTFRTIVHTSGLPEGYNGYAYGTISSIGTTTIPEIESLLAEGKGPERLDSALLDMLKTLQSAKNYRIVLSGAVNTVDSYTVRNYYSKNLDDDTLSKGFAGSSDGVFRYRIDGEDVVPGEVVSNGTGGVFSSIWGMTGLYSFYEMSLTNLTYEKKEDGAYSITNFATVNTFAQIAHVESDRASDTANTLSVILNDTGMEFTLNVKDFGVINGTVDQIGSTGIPEIEAYVSSGGGPLVYEDFDDAGRQVLSTLNRAKNYSLRITSTYASNAFVLEKKFVSNAYYQEYQDHRNDFGYIERDDGIFRFSLEGETAIRGDLVKEAGTFLWTSGLFKGFNDINTSSVTGKKISDTRYTITDNDTKNILYQIAGFGMYDIMFVTTGVSFTILDAANCHVKFTIDLGNSGSVEIEVYDFKTTAIGGIDAIL